MQRPMLTRAVIFSSVLGSLAVASADAGGRHRPPSPSEFEFVTINIEQNATDGDTEVVITAKAGDEGLTRLAIRAPDGRHISHVLSPDRSTMGLREFLFESPEPGGEAILAAYPEGTYTFIGTSTTGERFRGTVVLSHALPAPVTILHPQQDAEVPSGSLTILWSAVPGIREYVVEFENESADPEQVLRINLPPDATSFEIPSTMLVPGADYQVGVWTISDAGNVSVVETTFTTED